MESTLLHPKKWLRAAGTPQLGHVDALKSIKPVGAALLSSLLHQRHRHNPPQKASHQQHRHHNDLLSRHHTSESHDQP